MRRIPSLAPLISLALLATAVPAWAKPDPTVYLGLYLQGQKIGWSRFSSAPGKLEGRPVQVSDSRSEMDMGVLGTPMRIEMDSRTWSDPNGRVRRMDSRLTSAGRVQRLQATFGAKQVTMVIDNSGQRSRRTVPLPAGEVVDDPVGATLVGNLKSRRFYVLDPMTATFVRNEVRNAGPAEVEVRGQRVKATLLEVVDPRANTKVYVSAKGDLIKAEAPLGIEMIPEPKSVATRPADKYRPAVDLAYATSLKTDRPIGDPATLSGLRLRITGKDLSGVPSDTHQTVTRDGDAWIVDVHPTRYGEANGSAPDAKWTKPDHLMPADDPAMRALATRITDGQRTPRGRAVAIQRWVYGKMRANAGIGVLRDAREVLATREGVCRDYAVLTGTLLRAAGLPTRMASGLVNWDGTFYYHAWNEVWDGGQWVGVDATTDAVDLSAAHVKLAGGTVDEAFTFGLLQGVKIEVLEARRK